MRRPTDLADAGAALGQRPPGLPVPDPLDVAKDAVRKLTGEQRRQLVVWLLDGMPSRSTATAGE